MAAIRQGARVPPVWWRSRIKATKFTRARHFSEHDGLSSGAQAMRAVTSRHRCWTAACGMLYRQVMCHYWGCLADLEASANGPAAANARDVPVTRHSTNSSRLICSTTSESLLCRARLTLRGHHYSNGQYSALGISSHCQHVRGSRRTLERVRYQVRRR